MKTQVLKKIGRVHIPAALSVLLGSVTSWAQTTFNYTGTVQTYTVPAGITSINISASGAQGGGEGAGGGMGATMSGDFVVTPGQVLTVIVGQQGQLQIGGNYQNSSGGGGGSFVYDATNTLLVAAGGGGGKCNYTGSVPLHADAHGKVTADGGYDSSTGYAPGTGGNGGNPGLWAGVPCAGGGTGWLTPGGSIHGGMGLAGSWAGGAPYCGGGGGGCGGYGGFGGGGGGGNHYGGGGGGGGYSGGAGGTDPTHGGGGGSYNGGINQVNTGGVQTGNGVVTITPLCAPTSMTPDAGSLADLNGTCSVAMPVAPTATNDCGITYDGTPDVTFPVTAVGTTVVTWTFDDGAGNTATQTQNVVISGVDVSVSTSGPTVTANATGATFQWLDCNNAFAAISGETNATYAPSATVGSYAVEVTQSGCVDTSACTVLDFSGLVDFTSSTLRIYPNPSTDGVFTISFGGQILRIAMTDALGRAVATPIQFNNAVLDASTLGAGNYILTIYTDHQVIQKQVVITR